MALVSATSYEDVLLCMMKSSLRIQVNRCCGHFFDGWNFYYMEKFTKETKKLCTTTQNKSIIIIRHKLYTGMYNKKSLHY